jgi:PadR family transcriptional regulator PadR
MEYHDLLSGFVRLHILHHAAEGEIYGQWIIEELARHGYRLSPGTLYPMLQAMETRGYLTSREDAEGRGGRRRKVYTLTAFGREGLALARERLRELAGEVGRAS